MPYRRSTKRKSYRKPRTSRTAARYAGYAYTAYKMAKQLKGIINSEKKFFDTNITSAITSTATVTSLAAIAQGDDVSGRNGRSILCKSVQIRGTYASHASATASRVRIIIFSDRQNQGSTPAATDILVSESPEAMRQIGAEQGRFHVYLDKEFTVDNVARKQIMLDKYLYLGNHHIKYEGTGTANVGAGSLWCLMVSNEATNTVSQNTNFRIRYYDN